MKTRGKLQLIKSKGRPSRQKNNPVARPKLAKKKTQKKKTAAGKPDKDQCSVSSSSVDDAKYSPLINKKQPGYVCFVCLLVVLLYDAFFIAAFLIYRLFAGKPPTQSATRMVVH
jgi:hypothetical protein